MVPVLIAYSNVMETRVLGYGDVLPVYVAVSVRSHGVLVCKAVPSAIAPAASGRWQAQV